MTMVPARIARCSRYLRTLDPLAQAIRFYPASWTKTLGGCEHLEPVLEACAMPGVITRADLSMCLGQIISAMREEGPVYAVAVPATARYLRLCAGISDHVRQALGLHWLLVTRAGEVCPVRPDEPLPHEPFEEHP